MNIGERIRAIRKSKGMTQKQVAEECGMADSAIRKYESGSQKPKLETLQRIATALNVSPTYLIGYDDKIVRPEQYTSVELEEIRSGALESYRQYTESHNLEESPNRKRMNFPKAGEINIPTDIDPEWAELDEKMKLGTATDEEAARFKELLLESIETSKEIMPMLLERIKKLQEKSGALKELERILDSAERATPEELNKIARLSEVITNQETTDDKK